MKTKITWSLRLLIVSAMLVATVCAFAACGTIHLHSFADAWTCDETSHWHAATCEHTDVKEGQAAHDWVESVLQEPSCTDPGVKSAVCAVCGYETQSAIPATGHALTTVSGQAPTCTEAGWESYSACTACDYRETPATLPALGHDEQGHAAKAPTCTEAGWDAYVACSRCDYSNYVEKPALGHDYSSTVTAPTCTEKGYTTYSCKKCDSTYADDYVAATGHTYGNWIVVTAATCTTNGSKERVCHCGAKETEVIASEGHTYGAWRTVVEATCTTDGSKERVCHCGNKQTDSISATGHNYSGAETLDISADGSTAVLKTLCAGCTSVQDKCGRCEQLFTQQKEATTATELILAKVYHSFVNNSCEFCGLKRTTSTGRVFAANSSNTASSPIAGATISLSGTDDKGWPFTAEVTTDGNGAYTLSGVPYGSYQVNVKKDGYYINEAVIRVFYDNQVQDNLYLVPIASDELGRAQGSVIDAKTGSAIAGITVYVREGTNVTTGDVLMTLKSGANGTYCTEGLEEGNYTLQFVDERGESKHYAKNTICVAILNNITLSNQNVTLTEVVGEGAMRVVLTWGATPSDLDSHMTFGTNGTGNHVYYRQKNIGNVSLDVDDISSYGPETITVAQIEAGYVYNYYVYNYSGGGDSVLSNSMARVTIYMGDEMLYSIPVAVGSGRYWNVFSYSPEDGFTIYNTIRSSM